ncbi:MAG: F0F1 ATP synthase subunit epsilon [Bdellovibrionaceae bacterium]|nr:F0F1 ATP synthase subunit epsilon [Pseudobdellovibrionaceae bacterium]
MQLSLISPDKLVFNNKAVSSIAVVSTEGCLQVLKGHAPLLTTLGKGALKFYDINKKAFSSYFVEGGYLEVSPQGNVLILAETLKD